MPDRIASDADAVTTYRAHLARSGGTRLPCLRLPEGVAVSEGDEMRLVLDGASRHARIVADSRGLLIRGAYDDRRPLRMSSPDDAHDATNRLVEWARAKGREAGDAVELDEVDPGHLYGLRAPGERALYEVTRRPNASLRDIADSVFGPE